MKICRLMFVVLMCMIILVGCANPTPAVPATPTIESQSTPPDKSPVSTLPSSPAIEASPTPLQSTSTGLPPVTAEASPTALAPTHPVAARYNLDASLDYAAHTLTVSETVAYLSYASETISDLILVVEPNLWPGGFTLNSITWEDGGEVSNYELKDDQLIIPLPQPLKTGDPLGLILTYQLELPEIPAPSEFVRPVPYGYTQRQTNIVDWYPYIPPYKNGEGWLIHPKWRFGEHQVFIPADFQVKFRLTQSVPDLTIAASAPAVQNGEDYSYHLENARTFALSASTAYQVQTTQVGDVTISSYFFPFDKDGGQEVLQNTADAVALFSKLFTPYQHASLSVVEADFLDGMEFDGLFFLSHGFFNLYDGTPKGYLTFIAAHETAHQWWYGLVGNDQALEPWLDEALCTYMEHVFYENVYVDYPPASGQSLVDWWWYYRVNFFDPSGWVDGRLYDFSQYRPYRDAVYLNGAKFLGELRSLIGDQAFFAFLKDYAIQNAYGITTGADFFTLLREHTSKDLQGLVSEYFQYNK